MKIIKRTLIAAVIGGGLVSVAEASQTTAQKFATCRAEAEVVYGNTGDLARVSLEGVRKAGTQLRLRVYTPEGAGLNVLCNVDKKTGEVLALSTSGQLTPPPMLTDI